MKKKLIALLITFLLLFLTYGIMFISFSSYNKPMPVVVNGAIDLSNWNFEESGVIQLDGQWELYPNKLLTDSDFLNPANDAEQLEPNLIDVPGSWSNIMDTLGMATYRVRIQVDDTDAAYGLKTASIPLSNRLIVNGKVVGTSGNPAEEPNYTALNHPYVSYFTLHPGWNEILFQIANYEFPVSSGLGESLYFGDAGQMSKLHDKAIIHDWIAVTTFLIMGLYFIGLFSQRKNDFSLVVFGVACIFIALFISVSGERVLLDVMGEIPFWIYYRIQMISAAGVGLGFFLYLHTAFRPYCFRWIIRVGLIGGVLSVLLHIVISPKLTAELFREPTTIYSTFALLYATYVFVLAALHKVAGSQYLAVAAMALNALALSQNLKFYFGVPIYELPPIEPFLVPLMLALFMSLQFANAFHRIEELSGQLLEADKLKDDFLARTSHEFKTPLHGVMNISQSMLDDAANPPTIEQREKLELVTDITKRLSQLVYDIMDLSKLKQGELRINPVPIDLYSVVELQIRIYSYLCTDRNIQLVNLLPEQMPLALGDESRLSQIIGNLLDNAIKHTEKGSIVVTGKTYDGKIEIAVQDTGVGIDPQDIPLIFEPFKSLENTQNHGFGLGLSIAKQLIELQNGTISVTSSLGAGSTFTFTLPTAEQERKLRAAQSSAPITPKGAEYYFNTPYDSKHEGEQTILIVDDQFINLKILLDALQAFNYHVIAVKNGREALEQIEQPGKIDLVILDLMMPGMSGYEVCQNIRKRYSLLELPVLMVTAAIHPQDKVAAFQAGANDYLPKPFDTGELKARIGSLLAMKESLGRSVNLEVAFLQSQIKPHFLYNVLNSIVAASYTDVDRARKLITDLADYLRGSFRFSNAERRIGFSEEFDLILTYINIEQSRFKDRIRFEYDIPEETYNLSLPPLLLQPLVENAIRHGIGDRLEGGTVTFSVTEIEGDWHFVVSDDGVGIAPEHLNTLFDSSVTDKSNGVGLLNINKRLKYEYGVELKLESKLGHGTSVTVRIPATSTI